MRYNNEPMIEMFVFETNQLIEQLEEIILSSEKSCSYSEDTINEIFRIMHTIKGSAAMMMYESISVLAHSIEDLFYFLREEKLENVDCSTLSDIVLNSADFIKEEANKIENGKEADGDITTLNENIKGFLNQLKADASPSSKSSKDKGSVVVEKQQYYIGPKESAAQEQQNSFKAIIHFDEGSEMENIRAFSVIHNLKGIASEITYFPEDIIDDDRTIDIIRKDGFTIYLKTDISYEKLHESLMETLFLKDLELIEFTDDVEIEQLVEKEQAVNSESLPTSENKEVKIDSKVIQSISSHQSVISVNVQKLDRLMDLVGEMTIAEAMVVQNPDLQGLELNNFQKAAAQLNKINGEIQDMVMSIRMVPLATTFHKMHRIVRDLTKKLNKTVDLKIIGEETEVDKNIIEHISDPLMHLVRNALDHGIESNEERASIGKSPNGTIILEAKNSGSDVLIIVKDDGKGLNSEKILEKAINNGLLYKAEADMTDKEIYNLILLPGFSTKENVSEFSGRGVGMDVVSKNVEAIGGSVSIDSTPGKGSSITLKTPLTLAIIDGMNTKVGDSCYTIPTMSIKESFRPQEKDIITDPDGNEMVMVRGQCYPILRIHGLYDVQTSITDFTQGILIMVEHDQRETCLFVDELLGQQQVVVKSLPKYIKRFKNIVGLAGCTLLGDGNISLILDISGLTALADNSRNI